MPDGLLLTDPSRIADEHKGSMKLLDIIIIAVVLTATVGLVATRAGVLLYEFWVQRRVARILERNASLLERENDPRGAKRS
jgi:hypothetical protein